VQTIIAAFLAAIGVYMTVPAGLLWALGVLVAVALVIEWWIVARRSQAAHTWSETLARVLGEMSLFAIRPVTDQAQWEQYPSQGQADGKRWNDELSTCLSKAELSAVFSSGVNTISLHGSFNQGHNDMRGVLYRWTDQLRRLA
jgi:hypothetical protein